MLRHVLVTLLLISPTLVWAQGDSARPANPTPATPNAAAIDSQPLLAGSERLVSDAQDRLSLAVELSTQTPAQFTDQRQLALLSGRNTIAFADLPATLLAPSLYWHSPTLPELRALSTEPTQGDDQAPVWQASVFVETGGNRSTRLYYQAEGLDWQSSYQLRWTKGSNEGQWREAIAIRNQTGIDLSGAQFTAVNDFGQRRALGRIPSLPSGMRWRALVGDPQSLTLTPMLVAKAPASGPQPGAQQAPVERRLAVDSEQSEAIGFAAGPVSVIHDQGDETTALAQTQWQPSQRGSVLEIAAGMSTAVRVERLQVDYRYQADGIENAWRITLGNTTDQTQNIRLEEVIQGRWQIEEGEADWQRTATGLERRITLAAGERREVGYRIRQRPTPSS